MITPALMLIGVGLVIYGTIALVCWLDIREKRREDARTAERLAQLIAEIDARAPYLKHMRGPHR